MRRAGPPPGPRLPTTQERRVGADAVGGVDPPDGRRRARPAGPKAVFAGRHVRQRGHRAARDGRRRPSARVHLRCFEARRGWVQRPLHVYDGWRVRGDDLRAEPSANAL